MTALKKYQKLESSGLWRDAADAQRREVVVAFGEASLILSDPRTGNPLAHWSLPAVQRINPGALPALYAPDTGAAAETLEVEDAIMVGAIETVRGAIDHARARPGRLRSGVTAAAVVGAVLLCVLWLPQALITRTAAIVPDSKRAEIGRMALADETRVTGLPCAQPLGLRAAGRLSDRVLGTAGGQILFVRDGVQTAAAGFALAEKLRAEINDPLVPLLHHAGLVATFRLLTSGVLPEGSLDGYAESALSAKPPALPDPLLLERFRSAGIASSPYAYALDPSGETVPGLIEADPFRTGAPPPILPDGEWISLQTICQDN
jgi:hypothetical protein